MTDVVALVVEDDEGSRALLRHALERDGMTVVEARTGREGLRALYRARPDVVLLDIRLPELDGFATLERIRQLTDVPVLMVSAEAGDSARARALRAGADDFMTKPFGVRELVARTEALLRRARPAEQAAARYSDGLVELDPAAAEARVAGRPLGLTPLELRLLTAFVRHPHQVLSADRLLELAWGDRRLARERVKIYVGYLRAKFREQGVEPPIETVRGFGYRYRPRRAAEGGSAVAALG